MAYIITGTATFSSQAFRDAARTRVDTALSAYTPINIATPGFSAGINHPTTTTMTVSIQTSVNSDTAAATIMKAIYDAWVLTNRHTSGFLSVTTT